MLSIEQLKEFKAYRNAKNSYYHSCDQNAKAPKTPDWLKTNTDYFPIIIDQLIAQTEALTKLVNTELEQITIENKRLKADAIKAIPVKEILGEAGQAFQNVLDQYSKH